MNVQKHRNYFQSLLLRGARVASPLKMVPGAPKAKGRMWQADATLLIPDFTISLSANFHGGLAETTEVAEAHLNIKKIVAHNVTPVLELTRASYVLVMLADGIYTAWRFDAAVSKRMREICSYNTNLYVGIPTDEEMAEIKSLGYTPILKW